MSKFVKDLITKDLRKRLDGVEDALLVDVIGLENNKNNRAASAAASEEDQPAGGEEQPGPPGDRRDAAGAGVRSREGTLAIVWGGEDIVSLAKEIVSSRKTRNLSPFTAKGGVMDGQRFGGAEVKAVSKWPSRQEQLSILVGQILSPGATLSAQLLGAGSKLASQIKKAKSEESGEASRSE